MLFSPPAFQGFVATLPGTSIVVQWGDALVAKVGEKVFALYSPGGDTIGFKVTEMSFELLTGLTGIAQAPYFAKRQWVSVSSTAPLAQDELAAYLRQAHAMIAAKLTRKVRAELGLP